MGLRTNNVALSAYSSGAWILLHIHKHVFFPSARSHDRGMTCAAAAPDSKIIVIGETHISDDGAM